mgnify:CR=1 FL=1
MEEQDTETGEMKTLEKLRRRLLYWKYCPVCLTRFEYVDQWYGRDRRCPNKCRMDS